MPPPGLGIDADPVAFQARARPGALAVREGHEGPALTYGELDALVGRFARALRNIVAAGDRVAVLGRNSIAQIALALACQRAGAIFVPLSWRLTGMELAALTADCEPALLLHDDEFADAAEVALQGCPGVTLMLLRGEHTLADLPAPDRVSRAETADPDAPCTLLYTSGSTGEPKGVIITRSGAFHACLNMAMVAAVDSATVMLCDAPLFHTVGLFAAARTTLTFGGTLVLSDRFVPGVTLRRLSDPALGVTHYFGVPQIAVALLADPAWATSDLSRLKAMMTGGAPLPRPLIKAYDAAGVLLVNGYGMSETGTLIHMPLGPDLTRRHPGAIGHPAPGVAVRLVGADNRDVERGEDGEIWIKGPAVTPGYWRKPEATRAAFHDGWLRTGDVGRLEADGVYRLMDRRKDVYISGGENVYPAEIESVLLAHPGVQDAAVVGAVDGRWGESGVAFVVPRPGFTLDHAAIRGACQGVLARYKHPARTVLLDQLPRTPAGKVRKDALRALLSETSESPS